MTEHKAHWTEADVEGYVFRIAFDFAAYVKGLGEGESVSQSELAQRLGVSKGRVSQLLNNPGNLTLKQMVKVARALGQKVSVVTYDDGDARNERGPINSNVFTGCWEHAGKPRDLFDLREIKARRVDTRVSVTVITTIEVGWQKAGPEQRPWIFSAAPTMSLALDRLGVANVVPQELVAMPAHVLEVSNEGS